MEFSLGREYRSGGNSSQRIRRLPGLRSTASERFIWLRNPPVDVLPEWFSLFPPWLLVGVGLGLVASLAVVGAFVVGDRLFPTPSAAGPTVDGVSRRRAEIRDYLGRIDEPYAEDHLVGGERVAFYLPARDVAITFDAQAYFRLERAGTRAVLCEHEMPGAQLGRRLPFETPEDRVPDDVASSVAAAFDRLELPPSATAEEVKSAYRERVKEVHPDHGGDPAEFRHLREAYATARDHLEVAA